MESSQYDVLKITKDSLELINKHQKAYDIIINTSTGRRTQALGILYSMITVPQFINKIVYITENTNEIIELPILSHGLSKFKVEILEMLSNGHSIDGISKMLERSKSMIYGHIRFLKTRGFVNESGDLTVAGNIVVSKF